ncbi:S-norcoclaurine synthase [Thalictrum thalictroides]|uniref:S-norcoclaurine synthase n=1 Tax=Thalictrum thalictroides TaxID=46969 RepID=A0A7J6UTE0_THATH|nr:S-norcoclaurine synthase [Thalictrum thalictroides]
MRAQVWSELEVNLPADDIWAVYSSPDLPRLIVELMPTRFQKIDVLQGDGTQGTILHITLQPSNSGPLVWKEQFTTIDHTNRIKVVRQIEGGFLDIGFTMYENIFTITARGPNACTIRATASFDVNEGFESNTSLITANWRMARAIVDYVVQNNAKKATA